MNSYKLNPPIVKSKTIAQAHSSKLEIPFLMNKSVGNAEYDKIYLLVKTVQSNKQILITYCNKDEIYFKDGKYWAPFTYSGNLFQVGQHYKAQLAYSMPSTTQPNTDHIGFYSTVTTFKFTSMPSVSIQALQSGNQVNTHIYNYTGVYSNTQDISEKVYSYEFIIYDNSNKIVASSGELLHNSSLDTQTTQSTDSWTIKKSLEENQIYSLVYKIKTVNGLECTSPKYQIMDKYIVASELFNYCNFIAENVSESACVNLTLKPKRALAADAHKTISGQFVLLRSSNEDDFSTWEELTRFILTSHHTSKDKFICKDYCVSQGVVYKYALQAYNNQNLYSMREETQPLFIDFEDMFLSDGKRQLKIKFNPKVSSFKNTLLESKTDTIGGRYPFFFRNGNVKYKEFPISGLISMLMDDKEEFLKGVQITQTQRVETPASMSDARDLATQLTGDNFRREREFKLAVLEWLTDGKPKLFRSPGEGSYIVRLMNTSLSPNDTLGRMLHTFSCTAYEVAEYNFENLRKYGMMLDEYTETRDLSDFRPIGLDVGDNYHLTNLKACIATVVSNPGTRFLCKLQNDTDAQLLEVGSTGMYIFQNEVLAENPLMEISPPEGVTNWPIGSKLIYATYVQQAANNFSHLYSVDVSDEIEQWIGRNRFEANEQVDENKILLSIGLIYYLNISQKHINIYAEAIDNGDGTYRFENGGINYDPGFNELIHYNNEYYYYDPDERVGKKLDEPIDFTFQLREGEEKIDLSGTSSSNLGSLLGCDKIVDTSGRIVLTNIKNANSLYIGNGLFADIAYQKIHNTYTVEMDPNSEVYRLKEIWNNTHLHTDWEKYYTALTEAIRQSERSPIINAI